MKAFNAVLANTLAEGSTSLIMAKRIAIPFAGDDAPAKAIARQLVNNIGFATLDAG